MPSSNSSETEQFNRDVQFLLKPKNPNARSLLAFIHRTIRQFGLQVYITEIDIFVEAYLRGVKYTQEHQTEIRQPKAWMRRTAYNIIRECKRDRQRYSALAFDELMDQGPPGQSAPEEVDSADIADSISAVLEALERLSPGDRSLIQWQIVEGLSWQEVQSRLVAEGEDFVPLATLRKRGQRALERLRRAYHIVNGEPGSPELEGNLSEHPDGDSNQRYRPISTVTYADADTDVRGMPDVATETTWSITLEGQLTRTVADVELIEAIAAELRRLTGDASLSLTSIQQGSIIIELQGSDEGFKVIESLINSGQLTSILGLPVKKVGLVNESPNSSPLANLTPSCSTPPAQTVQVPQDRSALYDFLVNLPAAQFRAVLIDLDLPRENQAHLYATRWEQAAYLFDWLESSVGPGLDALRNSLVKLCESL
jgi:DNA-directed RNA polymerase specialized sigma24 family protein